MAKTWLLSLGMAGVFGLLVAGGGIGADDKSDTPDTPKKDKEPPDPPGTSLYMGYFRSLFDLWDLDKDGYLDKEELAKAFRGADAKPYDYKKPAKDDKTGSDPAKDDAKKDDPKKDDSKSDDPKKDDKKPEKKPDYSKYPDYNFLVMLDQDGDEKISRKEFLSWARDLSVQLKQQADAQNKLAQTQQKLANAKPGSKAYKRLQNELKKEESALQRLVNQNEKQLKALDKQVLKSIQKIGKK
jgi:hypothetical protein